MSYKKIIVIGNGCGIFKKENGHIIDNFDCVVRMGNCCIKGFEKYVGTKTDIYRAQWQNLFFYDNIKEVLCPRNQFFPFNTLLLSSLNPNSYTESIKTIYDFKKIYARYDNDIGIINSILIQLKLFNTYNTSQHRYHRILHDAFLNYFKHKLSIKNISYITNDILIYAIKALNIPPLSDRYVAPSNGIITIFYMLKHYPNSELYITGFDGFKTRNYWTTAVETTFNDHNSVREQIILKQLTKHNNIQVL